LLNPKVLICIPTYNERDNVRLLVDSIFSNTPETAHILFIDDGSPDGTGGIIDEFCLQNSRVHVLHRSGKQGLATAYIQGFQWGMQQPDAFEWFMEMDADFSHDPAHLRQFFQLFQSQRYEAVCGSRYVPGGGVSNWSRARLMLSMLGSVYSRIWLRYEIQDWTGGFNAWSRKAVELLRLESLQSRGYAFQIELKYRASEIGLRLIETPIVFQERRAGKSKMSGSIVREAVIGVMRLKWKQASGKLFAE